MTRKVVRDKRDLREVSVMLTDSDVYCIDIETVDRGYPDTKLTGVGVGCEKDGMYAARYIPIAHKKGLQLPLELVMEVLVDGVNSSNKMAVFHNAKYDIKILRLIARKLGLEQFDFRPDNVYCTMLASWFLDTENPHGLKELGERYLDILMTELDEFCEFVRHPKTNDKVYLTDETDIDVMAEYGYDDVIVPLKLKNIFDPEIEKEGFEKPMYDLKMPEMFELMDMEETGVFIDQKELDRVIETAPEMLEEVKKKIFELRPGGKEFNPNSPQQLAGVLFEEIGVNPIGEKGASGHYSTKKDYLEKWAAQGYEICEKVIDYRQVSKLLGTFAKGIKNRLWKDGRLRTRYNQIIRTGRTSSRKPNLQNIPRPSNDRFNLRGLFVAPEGKKLMAAD